MAEQIFGLLDDHRHAAAAGGRSNIEHRQHRFEIQPAAIVEYNNLYHLGELVWLPAGGLPALYLAASLILHFFKWCRFAFLFVVALRSDLTSYREGESGTIDRPRLVVVFVSTVFCIYIHLCIRWLG